MVDRIQRTAPTMLPLRVDHADVSIGGKQILNDITLTIQPGTRTVILGANGAGKSTLLRLLHGLVAPGSGTAVNALGESLTRTDLRANDAMLFQRPIMLRTSAIGNVTYAARQLRDALTGEALRAAAASALNAVGLAELADRPARVLSGGEQQRVAFARALVRQPQVMYLDEPTASLDPQSARQIEALILEASARGVTIVMTTHNIAQAKRIGSHIVLLNEGQVAEHTPSAQFFAQPSSAAGRTFLEGEAV
jgi:tungstate transport system ATP-binding protein